MPYEIAEWVPCLNKDPNFAGHEIGDYTYGHPRIVTFHGEVKLKIGKFCSIGGGAVFFLGGEHHTEFVTTYPFSHFFKFAAIEGKHPRVKGDITVGNDVWIGEEAFILSGVTIGNGAVVGARSVVSRDVNPYAVVAGNPAKFIRYRVGEGAIALLLKIAWWNWPIEKVAEAMPLLLSDDIEAFVEKYHE